MSKYMRFFIIHGETVEIKVKFLKDLKQGEFQKTVLVFCIDWTRENVTQVSLLKISCQINKT